MKDPAYIHPGLAPKPTLVVLCETTYLHINGFDQFQCAWLMDRINGTELARAELAVAKATIAAMRAHGNYEWGPE